MDLMPKVQEPARRMVVRTGPGGRELFQNAMEEHFLDQRVQALLESGKIDFATGAGLLKLIQSTYPPDRLVVRSILEANEPEGPQWDHVLNSGVTLSIDESAALEENQIILDTNELNI